MNSKRFAAIAGRKSIWLAALAAELGAGYSIGSLVIQKV